MNSCCNDIYNTRFDCQLALQELTDFQRKGAQKNSIPLLDALRILKLNNATLLDIGGGVGAVIFGLINKGVNRASYVDISTYYGKAFQREAKNQSINNQTKVFIGDFVDLHNKIDKADLVTLDKVICCYKNYQELVKNSLQKARKWYAFTIPVDSWWMQIYHLLRGIKKWLLGKTFRSYLHPVKDIESMATSEGFQKIYQRQKGEWVTMIFEK